jgi:hypothetical protein
MAIIYRVMLKQATEVIAALFLPHSHSSHAFYHFMRIVAGAAFKTL